MGSEPCHGSRSGGRKKTNAGPSDLSEHRTATAWHLPRRTANAERMQKQDITLRYESRSLRRSVEIHAHIVRGATT